MIHRGRTLPSHGNFRWDPSPHTSKPYRLLSASNPFKVQSGHQIISSIPSLGLSEGVFRISLASIDLVPVFGAGDLQQGNE